jgi:hypothetical protein
VGRRVAREIDDALSRLEEEWRGSVGDRRLATMRACLEAFVSAGEPPRAGRTPRTMRIR